MSSRLLRVFLVAIFFSGGNYLPANAELLSLSACNQSFTLGEQQDKTLKEIDRRGGCNANLLQGSNGSRSSYLLQSKGNVSEVQAELIFTDNRLSSIRKYWDLAVHDQASYAQALIGLLHKFEDEGYINCHFSTSSQTDVQLEQKSATMICGPKRVELHLMDFKGAKSVNIIEILE